MAAPRQVIGYASDGNDWWTQLQGETTPEVQWPQSIATFDRMCRGDAQVTSVLRAVTLPVQRTMWRLDPLGAPDAVVRLVAEDLGLQIKGAPDEGEEAPLRTKDRFSWTEHLATALLMLRYGHMPFEQEYRVDAAGYQRLRRLGPRMPSTLEKVNVATDGGLVSIQQRQLPGQVGPRRPIPVSQLVMYVHAKEGTNWLGTSLLRPAYKHWLLKDRLLRVQAETIERNGMGIPTYEAASNNNDELDRGEAIARSVRSGATSGAATPAGAKLRLMGVEGELPDAMPAIDYHDQQIARAVLAHFLNLGTQTGSWALGSTFADFFTLSLQTVAQTVADIANQHIIEDLVDLNFGPTVRAPRLVFEEIGSRQVATAQAIKLLVDAGVILPDRQLEESVRTTLGLPPKGVLGSPPAPTPTGTD